jgi:Lrp/AsnC family transcriptional regulator for asnA, asnC and gidA
MMNSTIGHSIDDLDRRLLLRLRLDARTPYLEIARELGVSGGTIHQRVRKLEEAGVLLGTRAVLDTRTLGYGFQALIGIHLNRAQDCGAVIEILRKFPQIVEAHYTTGLFALIVKVVARDTEDFTRFLMRHLQTVAGVRSTETFLSLAQPIEREVPL